MKVLANKPNPENIVLGPGAAIFINWTKGEKNMIDVGATQGDLTFTYAPEFENIKIRGKRNKVKGLTYVPGSETKIKASYLEFLNKEILQKLLLNAKVQEYTKDGKNGEPKGKSVIIRANESLLDYCGSSPYLDDVTVIGTKNNGDIYRITVFNALPISGLEAVFGDAEVAPEVEFEGYNNPEDQMTPPFEIEIFEPAQVCPVNPDVGKK
ncbi:MULTISPECIES: hypothetical protein [unclassified Bacillus cereus group]|uniref:hypothetical protein n=1 Tax=unclassified Bacillus cereus group TaxID=2750818 RepID=UPI001F589F0D|nr:MULTISPECIES: hypothetical protein [unclassified Bacillus cereus group]